MSDEIQSIYQLPIGSQREYNGLLLTLTEEGWCAEVQHSMMRRCKGWDYCKPWTYLITIGCQHHDEAPRPEAVLSSRSEGEEWIPIPATWCHPQWLIDTYAHPGRPHLFGELTGATGQDAAISLNPFGSAVEQAIKSITDHFPQVRIIEKVVMPNHLHIILRVKERLPEKKPLGYIIDRFKSWVNRSYKELCLGLPASTLMDLSYQQAGQPVSCSQSVPCSQSGTESTKQSERARQGHGRKNPKIGLVFEAGFHDRILFREGQLQNMIDYCRDNPRRLWMVAHNSQYFHAVSGIQLTMPLLNESGTKGRARWNGPVEGLLAPISSSLSGTENTKQTESTTSVTFTVIGNMSLLKVPERMQIQCSRSMTEAQIEALKEDVLEACQHGVVPISPCISPGEKSIARSVMVAGYNLIALLPQGIPGDTKYKPYKEFFDACANGQLLLLSPWKFENGVNHLARWQCLFLNDIAMQLTADMVTVA